MKESLSSSYPGLIFRETFNSEQSVRKNGGTDLTDVGFSDGVGSFNGSSSYISYPSYVRAGSISISVWFKTTTNAYKQLAGEFIENGTNGIRLNTRIGGVLWIQIGNPSDSIIAEYDTDVGDVYYDGKWHNLVATYDETTITMYYDGVLVDTIASTRTFDVNDNFLIGSLVGSAEYFDGTIDLVEIYNRALTASEVANLYNDTWNKELGGMGGQKSGDLTDDTFETGVDGWQEEDTTNTQSNDYTHSGSNSLKIVQDGTGYDLAKKELTTVVNQMYKLDIWCYKPTAQSGAFTIRVATSAGGNDLLPNINTTTYGSWVNITGTFVATTTTSWLVAQPHNGSSSTDTLYIDDVQLYSINPKTLIDFDSTQGVLSDKTVGNTVGDAIIDNDFDFTSGWTAFDGTVESSNSFQQASTSGGVYKNLITSGKKYRIHIKGNLSNSNILKVGNSSNYAIEKTLSGDFDEVVEWTANEIALYIFVQTNLSTLFTISYLQVEEIRDDLESTDVTVNKNGALFNGSTSKIDTGTDMIGTKAVTVMGWIKPYGYGEGAKGMIINNEEYWLSTSMSVDRFQFTSDGLTNYIYSGTNVIKINKWIFIAVTREADGTVNFYIGDKSNAPTLSGSADQSSGTPVAGTSNVIIGNNNIQTRTFDGLIPMIKVVEGILTLEQITQHWSESLKEIN